MTAYQPGSAATAPAVSVSVVIPAYNAAPFIGRTLASVIDQSRPPDEILLVNDGSPDTNALERAIGPFRDRIVYLAQENGGPGAARNTGILAARGAYVAFLDSDDEWMREYLSTQLRHLEAAPDTDLIYSNGVVVGDVPEAGRELMALARSRSHGEVTFERLVTLQCTVLTSCVIARRQALVDVGLFDPRFRRSEDFHLWARLAWHGRRLRYHRTPLVRHTRRTGSLSHDLELMAQGAIDVFNDLGRVLPLTPQQSALVAKQVARFEAELAFLRGKRLFLAGDYAAASSSLGRAASFAQRRLERLRLAALRLGVQLAPRLLRRTYGILRHPTVAPRAEGG